MKPDSRKLLQPTDGVLLETSPSPTTTVTYSPDPLLQSGNASSSRRPFKPSSSFDSSMALTVLVLLAALFFMGFFSIYVRRFADETSAEVSRRRRRHHHHHRGLNPLPFASSSLPPWWSNANTPKGVDPSTVRSLPLVSYRGDAKRPIDCAICLSEFEEEETVKMIPYCRHAFHPECIDVWLSLHVSCPVCRSTKMSPVVEEVRLGVVETEDGNHDREMTAAVERSDGSDERRSEVESTEVRRMRRVCSCSSLGDPLALQRNLSF